MSNANIMFLILLCVIPICGYLVMKYYDTIEEKLFEESDVGWFSVGSCTVKWCWWTGVVLAVVRIGLELGANTDPFKLAEEVYLISDFRGVIDLLFANFWCGIFFGLPTLLIALVLFNVNRIIVREDSLKKWIRIIFLLVACGFTFVGGIMATMAIIVVLMIIFGISFFMAGLKSSTARRITVYSDGTYTED